MTFPNTGPGGRPLPNYRVSLSPTAWNQDSRPIASPCDISTSGPCSWCGSGQEAQRLARAVLVCTPYTDSREADAMRKLTFGMNLSVDGYIAAPGGDLGWSMPSDELFQWWSDRVGATGLALYGRKLWETMSSHWPTADKQPGATPA